MTLRIYPIVLQLVRRLSPYLPLLRARSASLGDQLNVHTARREPGEFCDQRRGTVGSAVAASPTHEPEPAGM